VFYKGKKQEIHDALARLTLDLPHYQDLEWRFEVQVRLFFCCFVVAAAAATTIVIVFLLLTVIFKWYSDIFVHATLLRQFYCAVTGTYFESRDLHLQLINTAGP